MRTLIIGAGLSGLALADALAAQGRDYRVIDARNRVGGRIMTEHHGQGYFDLGPAWFWPGQPRLAALIDRLGLQKFDQHAKGILTFEDGRGQVQRGRGFASMQGAWRLVGGLSGLTDALAARLDPGKLRLNAPATAITRTGGVVTATLANGDNIEADQVVLALPPRVAAQIRFDPALPPSAQAAMAGVVTWMAGQAKALAVYDRPFWREAGLSGDATSRFGPMVEIHDASPSAGGPYGLFGFIGVPPRGRTDEVALRAAVLAQLVRLFGPDAATPVDLYLKDWVNDPYTATLADAEPLSAHPDYAMPAALDSLWDRRLLFAGTEVASEFGGYLEGALVSAEEALAALAT